MRHEERNTTLNRCRPGHGASCALCCGSHNYTRAPEQIGDLFYERACLHPQLPFRYQEGSTETKLFADAMQCPHVGMDSSDAGCVCCLIYSEADRGDDVERFFRGTCRNFYCKAWDDLTDEEVLFAARLMGDWYYYGLFINDIAAVQEMSALYGTPENVPPEEIESLKETLEQRLMDEDGK